MRVLLIRVPAHRHVTENARSLTPYGLAMVAAAVREAGHEVAIVDAEVGAARQKLGGGFYRAGMPEWEIVQRLREFRPDVVGLSCMFANAMPSLLRMAGLVRWYAPTAITVAGGYAPSTDPSAVIEHVNYVVVGEGELALVDLLNGLERRESVPPVIHASLAPDLDALPFPAYDLINLHDYVEFEVSPAGISERHNHELAAGLMTSRGCPVGCNFCSVQFVTGKPLRKMSPARVAEHVERLRDRFGVRKIHFYDDNLTLNGEHARAVFKAIAPLGIAWNTTQGTAAWNWEGDMLDAAVESGLQYLIVPVESGDDRVLRDVMHKRPLKTGKVDALVKRARSLGLGIQAWAIIGNPGETKAEMERTLAYMNTLDVDYRSVAVATPYPGSELFKECVREGWIKAPVDFSRLQRSVSIISTREWSAGYVTARAAAWLMRGRVKSGQGWLRALRRCYDEHGALATARALWHVATKETL